MEVLTEHTDPLTEENMAALLLSSYCVHNVFCVYFYFVSIYYMYFFSYFISFLFFLKKKNLLSQHWSAWTPQAEL